MSARPRSSPFRLALGLAAALQVAAVAWVSFHQGDVSGVASPPSRGPSNGPTSEPSPTDGPGTTPPSSTTLPPVAQADVRITGDDTANSYRRSDGGQDAITSHCSTGRRPQNEPSVAIDPRDPNVIVAGANDYCPTVANSAPWAGFYRSTDGGHTWTNSLVPGYQGDTSASGQASPARQSCLAASDPALGFDGEGRVFYGFVCFVQGPDVSAMVARYDRGGEHYLGTTVIARPTATTDHDKIAIAVDHSSGPTAGIVYAAWVELSGPSPDEYEQGRILFARSTDHGASFSEPIALSRTRQGSFPDVAIGPDGAVYVSYRSGITIWITKSETAGESFGSPWLVASVSPFDSEEFSGDGARDCGDGPFRCPSGFTFARFATQAAVTADETGVHVAWNGKHQGQSKVFVRNSLDGVTWDRPAIQVDEVDEGHQFMPDIASADGAIAVVFHDSREDAAYDPERPPGNTAEGVSSGGAITTFVARSTDGGLTWAEVQVSTSASNFGLEVPFQVPFWGDYISIAAVPGSVFVAWTDSRDVKTGEDPLEPGSTGDTDGFDVLDRCTYSPRDMEAERFDSPESDDPCLAAGGYDENIYGAAVEAPPG